MKKVNKKLINLGILALIFFISVCFIYMISLSPYDELWNFQNVYKMNNGLDIYKNSNVIITPIFYFLSLAFFKVFGANIISFRIFNIILYFIMFFLIFKIFKELKISKHISIVFLSIIITQSFQVISGGANYNILAIIFILLGMLAYLNLKDNKYFHYLQGLIIYLVFFSKQNLGIYYALSVVFYEFIYRQNFKTFFINQLKKFIIFLIPLAISIYILNCNNILFDFINYAFGGLFNFGSSNIVFSVSAYILFLCSITLIIYLLFLFGKKKLFKNQLSQEFVERLNLIMFITIGVSFSVYPIFNTAHLLFITPFYLIWLFYFLDYTILEDFFPSDEKNYSLLICFIILFFIFAKLSLYHFLYESNYIKISEPSSPYYNIYISPEYYEKINTMEEYINIQKENNKNVVIIAFDAAFTMVHIQQNNNEFDLVFNGNLGYDGENKMIQKISSMKNTQFLILTNEEDCFWQESEKIRNYIINNLSKTGEILNYSIYENY